MKPLLKSFILLLLTFSLALALLSCTQQKQNEETDDSWMNGDIEMDPSDSSPYAHPQEQEDDSIPQSGDRVDLPFVPLG